MKTREDFVSNSSSSSFVVFGMSLTEGEVDKMLEAKDLSDIDELLEGTELVARRGIDTYYGEWCVGLPWKSMKSTETKAEFLGRVKEELSKVLVLKDKTVGADMLVDGGYDG